MMGTDAPQSMIVIGGGIVAYAAAIAFRRALPMCEITLLSPATPAATIDQVGAASAAILDFHQHIGLNHAQFMRRCDGTIVREQLWTYASGSTPQRVSAASAIPYRDGVAIHQLWLAQDARGDTALAWADLAAGNAIADDHSTSFGVRFDATRYHALLKDFARHLAIHAHQIDHWQPETGDGRHIAAITTEGAQRWCADFYIDATTTPSPLLSMLGAVWLDWSDHIPAMTLAGLSPPRSDSQCDALNPTSKWMDWHSPKWSARLTAAQAADSVPTGRLSCTRHGNAMALGDAALVAPSFDGGSLGVACLDIMRAIKLLPGRVPSAREAAEYARQTAIIHDYQGDWAASRWLHAGDVVDPTLRRGLSDMLMQFTERARIPVRDMDHIPPGQWLGWLIALGIRPRRTDPTARAIDPAVAHQYLHQAASRSALSRSSL